MSSGRGRRWRRSHSTRVRWLPPRVSLPPQQLRRPGTTGASSRATTELPRKVPGAMVDLENPKLGRPRNFFNGWTTRRPSLVHVSANASQKSTPNSHWFESGRFGQLQLAPCSEGRVQLDPKSRPCRSSSIPVAPDALPLLPLLA